MSKRFDEFEERLAEYESQIDTVYRLYHIPVLAALMLFMLWIRARNYARHIGPDGEPLYRGNDPYLHYRHTNYVIENFPYTMPFDPWTGFDVGSRVGQFGTILDQMVAAVALIVGLGSPSQETIVMVTLLSGPVFAMLCAIPMYYIGKRLGGRFGGIIAVVVLALSAGQFLSRSVAGYYGHHTTEVLFTLIAIAVGMKMLSVAQRERPIYEFIQTREFELLKEPAKWAVGFGITLVLAVLNWPPAIFLFGVFAAFLFVILSIEFIRGYSPDHITIPSVIAMVTAAVLILPVITTTDLTATDYSIIHPIFALAVAGGAIFMAGVARLWEQQELPRFAYPIGVAGSGLFGIVVVALVLPDLFDFFVSQVQRVAGLGATDTAGTIGEARAPENPISFLYQSYGLGFYTALAGFGLLLYHAASRKRPRAGHVLVAVFTAFMLLFTLTQLRFDYYLVIGIGAGNAYIVGWIYQFVDLDNVREDIRNVKPYQILIVVAILFVITGPLLVSGATFAAADGSSQPGEMQQWTESLDWLSEETPEVGAYGTGDDPRLEKYGTYEITDDFEYEEGEYGVIAWWDYGHYITQRGDRIPVANPHQQHGTEAADFLLADDEAHAIEILDEDQSEGEGVQYAMIDYQLGYAGTQKYSAPTAFESRHDVSSGDVGINVINPGTGQPFYGAHTQRGYESMRVSLYQHYGSAQQPSDLTLHFGEYAEDAGVAIPQEEQTGGDVIQQHESPEEAEEVASGDPRAIHGGVLGQTAERTEAVEQFRLVHAGGPIGYSPFAVYMANEHNMPPEALMQEFGVPQYKIVHSAVKTFERVDGATIEGQGPANVEVQATVEMEIPTLGLTFPYTQYAETDENGNFEMTVPYSTTGYDEYGPEDGFTNPDVRANSSYRFFAQEAMAFGEADVSEAQVIGEDDSAVTVELEEIDLEQQPDNGDEVEDEPNGDDGTESDDNEEANGETTEEDSPEASQITRTP